MTGSEAWGLGAVLFGAGLLLLWLGNRQRTGSLKRNWLAGLRTPATLESDEAWQAAHLATAGLIIASGLPQVATGIAIVVLRPEEPVLAALVLGSMAVTVGLVLVAGVRGDRIARQVADGHDAHRSEAE